MAAPPTRPRLRARYDARRQAVLDAAARVFAERGFHATSMQDLVEATGLAAGGLYHYIGSKDELLFSLFDQLLDPLLEQAREIVGTDEPPEVQLRTLVRAWVAHVARRRDHMIVFQQEWRGVRGKPEWRRVREARRAFEDILGSLFERTAAAGSGPHDPELARLGLLGMVNYTPQWFSPDGRLSPEQVADGYCALVMGADGAPRTGGPGLEPG